MNTRIRPALVAATSALGLIMSLGAATAEARDRAGARAGASARGTVAAPRHGDWERRTQRSRTDDGRRRDTEWRGPRDRSATATTTIERDREAGTRTRQTEVATSNGTRVAISDVATRTDDGYTREIDRTVTLPNGETRSSSRDTTVTRTGDGHESTTVATHPRGTITRTVDVSRDAESGTVTREVTVDRERAEP